MCDIDSSYTYIGEIYIIIASFTFLLCQLDSRVSTLAFFMDTLVSCGTVMNYSCWFIQFCMFFESLAECSHGFTNVCVAAVIVTRDVIDSSILVFCL